MVEQESNFPYEVSMPEFGVNESSPDGTVLYLNELMMSEENTIILKGASIGDFVQLVTSDPITESGLIVNDSMPDALPEVAGFHYYDFANYTRVYSEFELSIQVVA